MYDAGTLNLWQYLNALTFAGMRSKDIQALENFRKVAKIEGYSYLILLFIAMPLKYFADVPQAVTVVGWAHGVLFVAFIALLLNCAVKYRWSFVKIALAFIAGLVPFGTFVLNRELKKEAAVMNEARYSKELP